MARIRRILHPSDFSRASAAAFNRAVEMAAASRAEVIVAHVLSPIVPWSGEGYIPPKTYEEIEASSRAYAQKSMRRLLAKARKAGVRARGLLLEGVAHERVVQAARTQRADLIVMGTHGRSGLPRFFLGSVADRVVAMAACPVMTVRGRR